MTEENKNTVSLVKMLSEVQKELDKIEKDGKNNRQGFEYVSEAQVKAKLQKKLAEHGIMIIPSYEILNTWTNQTNNGKSMNYASVMGKFKLTNGTEGLVGSMPGIGMDSGDKAIYKAETGAQKNFLMQLFLMSTGDDPENDSNWNNQQPQYNNYNQNSYNNYQPQNQYSNQSNNTFGNFAKPQPKLANETKKKVINEQLSRLSDLNQTDFSKSLAALQSHFPNVDFNRLADSSADNMIAFLNKQIDTTKATLKQLGVEIPE